MTCAKAELVHGTPLWASQSCGFCRWQRSLEVRRQWKGEHFCMNPFAVNQTPSEPQKTTTMAQGGDPGQETPSEASDPSEGGWSQQSGSSSSRKESGRRKKSVRFQEPLRVEKKRSSLLARFTRERSKTR
ncbi:hypothetical protein PG994_005072 [Apiospora phragmitis]|uniref:Uncharacterized protein n=1 Tax=Apiospora phragmitis TaxID=2905665 RepID=A0ABR1VSD3_9PEZI